jgi:hypothetical protein
MANRDQPQGRGADRGRGGRAGGVRHAIALPPASPQAGPRLPRAQAPGAGVASVHPALRIV